MSRPSRLEFTLLCLCGVVAATVLIALVRADEGAASSSATAAVPTNAAPPSPPPPYEIGEGRQLGPGPAAEHSGIVKSRQWPDLFWMHNDSGDEPRIYPVRRDGTVYENIRYPDQPGVLIGGAINVDWEDIAVDASGHVIVADAGNNENDRRDLVLYFILEPAPGAGRTPFIRKEFFRYPGQKEFPAPQSDFNYDCEAIFTLGDDVHLCSKNRSNTLTQVYRLNLDDGQEVHDLELVDEFDVLDQATGADATADGKRIALCTYEALWLFEVTDPHKPLSGPVRWLPFTGSDDEVEAICFADDRTLIIGDESLQRIYEIPIERFVEYRR